MITQRTGDMMGGSVPEVTVTTIDRTNGTAEPVPLRPSEVRHVHIGMLQKCQQYEKHVHDEIGHQVEGEHRAEAC